MSLGGQSVSPIDMSSITVESAFRQFVGIVVVVSVMRSLAAVEQSIESLALLRRYRYSDDPSLPL